MNLQLWTVPPNFQLTIYTPRGRLAVLNVPVEESCAISMPDVLCRLAVNCSTGLSDCSHRKRRVWAWAL